MASHLLAIPAARVRRSRLLTGICGDEGYHRCTPPKSKGYVVEDPRLAENKTIARLFFSHFEKGDVAAVIDLFSPDAIYWMPTVRREFGMAEFTEGLHWIQSRLKDGIRFELGAITA